MRSFKPGDPIDESLLLFYTDTYCEGLTNDSIKYSYNGIIDPIGLVTDDFNVLRAAEEYAETLRRGYFEKFLECNQKLADTEQDSSRRNFYRILRDMCAKAYVTCNAVVRYYGESRIVLVEDLFHVYVHPYTEELYKASDLKTYESRIFFVVCPLKRLSNKLGNSSANYEENRDIYLRMAKNWRGY